MKEVMENRRRESKDIINDNEMQEYLRYYLTQKPKRIFEQQSNYEHITLSTLKEQLFDKPSRVDIKKKNAEVDRKLKKAVKHELFQFKKREN